MNRDQFDEKVFDKFEGDLIRSIRHGVRGVGMDLHEQAVDAGGDGGTGEDGSEFAIAAGGTAESAGALDGVGCYVYQVFVLRWPLSLSSRFCGPMPQGFLTPMGFTWCRRIKYLPLVCSRAWNFSCRFW